MAKLIYGIGYNSKGVHKSRAGKKKSLAYRTWFNMFVRCYCPEHQARYPAYNDCSVDERWRDFQDFADWHYNHPYRELGYELDKDLLFPNNKIYSPETCCFVPQELNKLLLSRALARGDYPQGVCFHKPLSKYKSQISINGKRRHLGYFNTVEEARQAYRETKEANVKRMALEWQDRIADDVFQALMNWQLAE